MNNIPKKVALVLFATAVSFAVHSAQANAYTESLIKSGTTGLAGGWNITVPTNNLTLVAVDNSYGGVAHLWITEQLAVFDTPTQYLTFSQASPTADPYIDLMFYGIANDTGSNWTRFQFILQSSRPESSVHFTGTYNPLYDGVNPGVEFLDVYLNATGSTMTARGFQLNGAHATWNATGGEADIDADPSSYIPGTQDYLGGAQTFTIEERGSLVPLPSAAWQALVGLAGLGAIAAAKKQFRNRRLLNCADEVPGLLIQR